MNKRSSADDPPVLTGGSNEKNMPDRRTSAALHWLTCTMTIGPHNDGKREAIERCVRLSGIEIVGNGRPFPFNYSDAFETTYGTMSWHAEHTRMKLCYNMTGADIENYYQDGYDGFTLIHELLIEGAQFTRVDVAIDYRQPADVFELLEAFRAGEAKTRTKTVEHHETESIDQPENERGRTIYIGSKDSARRLCVYNKAAERGEIGDWTRIEYRAKGRDRANQAAQAIALSGVATAGRTMIADLIDFQVEWWREAMDGPITHLPPLSTKDTKTLTWLLDQVAPVLLREIMGSPYARKLLLETYAPIISKGQAQAYQDIKAAGLTKRA